VAHEDLTGVLPNIWQLTGLSPVTLQQSGRPVEDVLRDALAMAVDCAWVAHHARHEVTFIQRQVRLLWKMRLRPIVIDTALVAQGLFRLRTPPTLEWLCEALDVPVTQRHQADADVAMTSSIWAKEVPLCHSIGLKTVGDVVEWSLAHGSG
jgi:DNA polymerase-3 subunit epsilon